jgi:hypothetical protein
MFNFDQIKKLLYFKMEVVLHMDRPMQIKDIIGRRVFLFTFLMYCR